MEYREKTLDSSFKGGVVGTSDFVIYLNKLNFGNFSYKILDEFVDMVPIVIYFRKHSNLDKAFNKKLEMLKSSGLVEYFTNNFMNQKYLRIKDEPQGPKTLTVKTLSGGLQLVIFGWLTSIAVFTYEVNKSRLKAAAKLTKILCTKLYLWPFIIKLFLLRLTAKLR
jgi:hypothetical protein